MAYPDFSKPFILNTDASNYALGAILSQDNHPICYASRTLNEHEVNYSTIENELLAIVWTVRYFLKLGEYTIKYKKGVQNGNADALSRIKPEINLIEQNMSNIAVKIAQLMYIKIN